jgi:hypothetical protein
MEALDVQVEYGPQNPLTGLGGRCGARPHPVRAFGHRSPRR